MTIGERIYTTRMRRSLERKDLAGAAKIPLSTLYYVESGKRDAENLTIATAKRIAAALGVTMDYLCGVYEEGV